MARTDNTGGGPPKPPKPPKPKTPTAPARGKGDTSRGRALHEAKNAGVKGTTQAQRTLMAVRKLQALRRPSLMSRGWKPDADTIAAARGLLTPDERKALRLPAEDQFKPRTIKDTGDARGIEVSPNIFMPRHPAGWPYYEIQPGVFVAKDPRGSWKETVYPSDAHNRTTGGDTRREWVRPAGPQRLPRGMVSPYSDEALPWSIATGGDVTAEPWNDAAYYNQRYRNAWGGPLGSVVNDVLDALRWPQTSPNGLEQIVTGYHKDIHDPDFDPLPWTYREPANADPSVSDEDLRDQALRTLDALRQPKQGGLLDDLLGLRPLRPEVLIDYEGPLSGMNPDPWGGVFRQIGREYVRQAGQTIADRWFRQREDEQKVLDQIDQLNDKIYDWFPTFPEKEGNDYKWLPSGKERAAAKKSLPYHGQGQINTIERQRFYMASSGDYSPWGLQHMYDPTIKVDPTIGVDNNYAMYYDTSDRSIGIPAGGFAQYGPVVSNLLLRHETGHYFDHLQGWQSTDEELYARMNENPSGYGYQSGFNQFVPQAWGGFPPVQGPVYVAPEPGPRANTSSVPSDDPTETRWLERWVTSNANTCPRCASLSGRVFWSDEGPQPPLHDHCGCSRVRA